MPLRAGGFAVGFGLFETTDRGRTWELRQPGNWGALTAFVEGGRTVTDGGRTWTPTSLSTVAVTVAVDPNDPNVVAVVDDETRFFRSADGGRSWPGP